MLTRLRSLDGYVLPHLLDVNAGAHGIVKSLLVSPHDVVRRGQALVLAERLFASEEGGPPALVVTAPVAGVVTRCWASTGDVVGGTWPILSIASSADVLVVARFAPGEVAIRASGVATVRLAGSERDAFRAQIVRVIEADATEAGVDEARATRVVLSFPNPPAKALWPGTSVHVEVGP